MLHIARLTVTTKAFVRLVVNSIVKGVLFELVFDRFESLHCVKVAFHSSLGGKNRF